MVNVSKVCSGPLRSTISPAPPAAHGTKTERVISLLVLDSTAALAGDIKIAITALRTIILVTLFIVEFSLHVKAISAIA